MSETKPDRLSSVVLGGLIAMTVSMVVHDEFMKRDIWQLRREIEAIKADIAVTKPKDSPNE